MRKISRTHAPPQKKKKKKNNNTQPQLKQTKAKSSSVY